MHAGGRRFDPVQLHSSFPYPSVAVSMSKPSLDPQEIVATVERLTVRINERFPKRNLNSVANELLRIARQAGTRAEWLARPIWPLRAAIVLFLGSVVTLGVFSFPQVTLAGGSMTLVEFVQGLESGINDVLFIGAGIFFLATWEVRIKRARALAALHELRSIAHVVDMYQLTKDPERVAEKLPSLTSSPKVNLTPFELARYLDYCSEMLALIGKIASVYAERLNDSVVLAAVNEIESLTNGLSRNVWQKIMIIYSTLGEQHVRAGGKS